MGGATTDTTDIDAENPERELTSHITQVISLDPVIKYQPQRSIPTHVTMSGI
jgi:hypothetical protein